MDGLVPNEDGTFAHSKLIADGASGDILLEQSMLQAMGIAFSVWKERQKKYGPTNIAAFGELGCMVRGYDKMARLRQALFVGKGGEVKDESIEDSWIDLANYALMGLVNRWGEWPK